MLFVLFVGIFTFVRYYFVEFPSTILTYCCYPLLLFPALCAVGKYSTGQKCLVALVVALADLFLYNIMGAHHFPYYISFASAALALLISYLVDRWWIGQVKLA